MAGSVPNRPTDRAVAESPLSAPDRRVWRLFLTERAIQLIDQAKDSLRDLEEEMLAGFDAPQRQALAEMLETIRVNLSNARTVAEVAHG